jgi:hypothetical protein
VYWVRLVVNSSTRAINDRNSLSLSPCERTSATTLVIGVPYYHDGLHGFRATRIGDGLRKQHSDIVLAQCRGRVEDFGKMRRQGWRFDLAVRSALAFRP